EDRRLLDEKNHKQLLAGYFHLVRERCFLRLRKEDAADDAAQQVFERLLKELRAGKRRIRCRIASSSPSSPTGRCAASIRSRSRTRPFPTSWTRPRPTRTRIGRKATTSGRSSPTCPTASARCWSSATCEA